MASLPQPGLGAGVKIKRARTLPLIGDIPYRSCFVQLVLSFIFFVFLIFLFFVFGVGGRVLRGAAQAQMAAAFEYLPSSYDGDDYYSLY